MSTARVFSFKERINEKVLYEKEAYQYIVKTLETHMLTIIIIITNPHRKTFFPLLFRASKRRVVCGEGGRERHQRERHTWTGCFPHLLGPEVGREHETQVPALDWESNLHTSWG